MKILFTRFPLESIKNGGAEKQTLSLMLGLKEHGYDISFAGSCRALLEMCSDAGIPTAEWDIGAPPVTKWGAISFSWRKQKMRKKLAALLNEFGIRNAEFGIVMLSLTEKLLLTDIAVNAGAKVFWLEHDRIGNWLTKNPWLKLLLKQSKRATTITVSELSKRMYEEMGFANVVAIANGVEEVKSEQLTENSRHSDNWKLETGNSRLRLGCIARLSPEKGVDVLIEAVKDLQNVTLTIVGSGPDESHIRHLANQQTSKLINLIPHIENINDFYPTIDALVLPSRDHDPFGLVAAEAMMRGIPVIVTDQCGIAGYLTDGKDAVIVEAGSVDALREGIERIRNSEFVIMIGGNGRKTAMEKFSIKRMIDEYEKTFKVI